MIKEKLLQEEGQLLELLETLNDNLHSSSLSAIMETTCRLSEINKELSKLGGD